MASEKEKVRNDEEEIVDLTEVIEEGDARKMKPAAKDSPNQDNALDDELKDLFDNMVPQKNSGQTGQDPDLDSEFEDLFRDEDERGEDRLPDEAVHSREKMDSLLEEGGTEVEEAFPENIPGSEAALIQEPGLEREEKNSEPDADHVQQVVSRLSSLEDRLEHTREQVEGITDDLEQRVLEILEDKGSKLNFIQELVPDNVDQALAEALEKTGTSAALMSQGLEQIGSRVEALEELFLEHAELIRKNMSGEHGPDLPEKFDELKREIALSHESRIEEVLSSWEKEKKSLTEELEKARTAQKDILEKLDSLSRNIDDVKEKNNTYPELLEKLEVLHQSFVGRDELDVMLSRIKVELEEHVQRTVPGAAAKVIREEIMAMLQEKKQDQD